MTGTLAEPFIEAAREHRLVVQTCSRCGARNLPPRMRCSICGGTTFSWEQASGRATLVSYVIQHRSPPEHEDRIPYVYALVRLAEGPIVATNITDCDFGQLSVGLGLRVTFAREHPDGITWPDFRPAAEEAD